MIQLAIKYKAMFAPKVENTMISYRNSIKKEIKPMENKTFTQSKKAEEYHNKLKIEVVKLQMLSWRKVIKIQ